MPRVESEDEDGFTVPLVSPRVQNFSELDDTVSRLEDHITREEVSFASGEAQHYTHETGFTMPDSAYSTASATDIGLPETHGPPSRKWERRDLAPNHDELVRKGYRSSPNNEVSWQQMKLIPKGTPIDPFSDTIPDQDAAYGAVPIGYGRPSSFPAEVANTISPPQYPANYQYSQPTSSTAYSSHDYDPERFAIDSTPNKLYSHPRNSVPQSRSPTPSETPPRPTPYYHPPSGLTRRVLSSKENNPIRGSRARSPEGHEYEIPKAAILSEPSPMMDSTTMHFGLPPRKQRRRNQGVRKLVPLTQYEYY